MHRRGAVAAVFQNPCQRIRRHPHIHLIRNRAGRREGHGIPGQHLKLGVAGHGAEHRHIQIPADAVFSQRIEIFHKRQVRGKTPDFPQVRIAFIHNADDVFRNGLPISGPRQFLSLFAVPDFFLQLCYSRLRIPFRRLYIQIPQPPQRTDQISVIFIGNPGFPHADLDGKRAGPYPVKQRQPRGQSQYGRRRRPGPGSFGHPPDRKQPDQRRPDQDAEDSRRRGSPYFILIASRHSHRRAQAQKIPHHNGPLPEADHKILRQRPDDKHCV